MAERRGDPPAPETGPQLPRPIRVGLSPVQQAQQARAAHLEGCRQCSNIDRERCATGEQLWREWTAALDEAYQQLHGESG